MVRALLIRGMIAGIAAAVLAFVYAYLFGEPTFDGAIAYEEAASHTAGEMHDHALVSRGVQSTVGLGLALVLYGVAIGGIFALVYAAVHGRVGPLRPRATAAVLGGIAYVVVILVPMIKYPANPPASTVDETVSSRTLLYLVMIGLSVAAAAGAAIAGRRLAERVGTWNGVLLASVGYVVVMGVVGALMPVVHETPAGFPPAVLYEFRLATLGMHLVLWAGIALVFGALIDGRSRGSHSSAHSSVGTGAV